MCKPSLFAVIVFIDLIMSNTPSFFLFLFKLHIIHQNTMPYGTHQYIDDLASLKYLFPYR